jgi:hypothetical protein
MARFKLPWPILATLLSSAFFVALNPCGFAARHGPGALHVPIHVQRGHRVQGRYDAYNKRFHDYYASLVAGLQSRAPELLKILEPPHCLQHGYQILSRIIADPAPLIKPARPQSAQYSWPRTDHLIDRTSNEVGRSVEELKRALSREAKMPQVVYQQLAARYRQLLEQQQISMPISSIIGYGKERSLQTGLNTIARTYFMIGCSSGRKFSRFSKLETLLL